MPRIASLHPRTLGDVFGDFRRVAEAIEVRVEILQPDAIASRPRGIGWERL